MFVSTHAHQTYTQRQMYQSFLESVPMLKSLEPYEMMNLADALERKYYSDGDCIIQQGDAAYAFYIVEDGAVKITKEDPVSKSNTMYPIHHIAYFYIWLPRCIK